MKIVESYNILVPELNNPHVKEILPMLKISTQPFYINIEREKDAEIDSCFENVKEKVEKDKGEIVYGWQFWEQPYMIEAEFHAVWKSPTNQLIDITPKKDESVKKILFVVDENKTFNGKQTDNIRINTTTSQIVDDIIELAKTRYRFLNKGERANIIGEIKLEGVEADIWQAINGFSFFLDLMYKHNCTVDSKCFCGSDNEYKNCHRPLVSVLNHYK